MALEQVGLDIEPRFATAGTADDQGALISSILGFLGTARHGEAFCLSENDVILECGVDIGGDVGRGAP